MLVLGRNGNCTGSKFHSSPLFYVSIISFVLFVFLVTLFLQSNEEEVRVMLVIMYCEEIAVGISFVKMLW